MKNGTNPWEVASGRVTRPHEAERVAGVVGQPPPAEPVAVALVALVEPEDEDSPPSPVQAARAVTRRMERFTPRVSHGAGPPCGPCRRAQLSS